MNTLKAEKRTMDTKAKRLRREGYVTGNVFGREMEGSLPVKIEKSAVEKLLKTNNKGSQIMLELKKHDKENQTQYMETLRVYLEQHLSATQAARELFIHRSTFLYRLDRIKEILQSELDDPEEIFYLELSFRLLEQEQEKE